MPTTVSTPNDLKKLELQLVALKDYAEKNVESLRSRCVTLENALASVIKRLEKLESGPTPTPIPVPPVPPPPAPPNINRQLLGGWRIAEAHTRGSLAIDFDRMKAYQFGHAYEHVILEYDLPARGSGSDINVWPILTPSRKIPNPANQEDGYGYGLAWFRGKLWSCPRYFYDMNPPSVTKIYATDGEVITVPVPRQMYAGFIKRGPGLDPYLGGGGDESGQGCANGPTCATLDGQVLISYPRETLPGDNLENWNTRAPRSPDYFPFDRDNYFQNPARIPHPDPSQDDVRYSWDVETGYWKGKVQDSWIGWVPRTINGVLEGRWATERVYSGGLFLPEGICYWPRLGVGRRDYAWQSECLAMQHKTTKYVYDPVTYQLKEYEDTDLGRVFGHEIGPDGMVYLHVDDVWKSDLYMDNSVIQVYG